MRPAALTADQQALVIAGTHYRCAACGGFFEKGWSEEEADAESKRLFGDLRPDDMVVVCDVCFQRGRRRAAGTARQRARAAQGNTRTGPSRLRRRRSTSSDR